MFPPEGNIFEKPEFDPECIAPRKYANTVSMLPYHHCIYTDNSGIIKMLSPVRI